MGRVRKTVTPDNMRLQATAGGPAVPAQRDERRHGECEHAKGGDVRTGRIRFRGLVLLGLAFVLPLRSALAFAEPEVTQGPPKATPEKTFTSPMIMKTKLVSALPENQGRWNSSAEFEPFLCDNVRLKSLESYVQLRDKMVEVRIFVTTYTELGIDKKVDILLELLGPESVIATGMLGPFQSEEGKRGYKRMTLRVPVDQWPTTEVPGLRMTMNVVDDP